MIHLNVRALGSFLKSLIPTTLLIGKPKLRLGESRELSEEEARIVSKYLPQLVRLRRDIDVLRDLLGKIDILERNSDPCDTEREHFEKILRELLDS